MPGLPTEVERCFISFIDVHSRYTYVAQLKVRAKTPVYITKFLDNVNNAFWKAPKWFRSDNAGEYISQVVDSILGDMEV